MGDNGSEKEFEQWLQRIGGLITAIVGFVTVLAGFAQLWQGNSGLVTLILLSVGIGLVWLACIYFARFWQPEKHDAAPKGFHPEPTDKQVQLQKQKVRQRQAIRHAAWVGLVLVPLLTIGGFLSWQQVASLPSNKIVILVADFDGPQGQNYRVTKAILNQLGEDTRADKNVNVKSLETVVTEQEGSNTARVLGKENQAALMIWGRYRKTDDGIPISANFEVLQPPDYSPEQIETADSAVQTFALEEMNSFQLQTQLSSNMSYLVLFTSGMTDYIAKDWTKAIASFEAALKSGEKSPDSLDLSIPLFYKGKSHLFNGEFEAALTDYNAALNLMPNDPDKLYAKGIELNTLGRYEESITAYNTALRLKPNYVDAIIGKGSAQGNLGRHEEALAAFNSALELNPNYPLALYNKGFALSELGRYSESILASDAALNLQPNYPNALYSKGTALIETGQYEEAITVLDMALKLQPNYLNAIHQKGIALGNLGRFQEAVTIYDQLSEIQPTYREAFYNKGRALFELDKNEEAIIAYETYLKLNPDDTDASDALYGKGSALNNLGRYQEAIPILNDAVKLKEDSPGSYFELARSYALLNQPAKSIATLKTLFSIDPITGRENVRQSPDFANLKKDSKFKELMLP